MLTGSCLCDDAGLPHPLRQQGLPEDVVDLVGAGVVEILAFEVDGRVPCVLREVLGDGDRRRAARVVPLQCAQLSTELGVGLRLGERFLEFHEGSLQCFWNELAAVLAEVAACVRDGIHASQPISMRRHAHCAQFGR